MQSECQCEYSLSVLILCLSLSLSYDLTASICSHISCVCSFTLKLLKTSVFVWLINCLMHDAKQTDFSLYGRRDVGRGEALPSRFLQLSALEMMSALLLLLFVTAVVDWQRITVC